MLLRTGPPSRRSGAMARREVGTVRGAPVAVSRSTLTDAVTRQMFDFGPQILMIQG